MAYIYCLDAMPVYQNGWSNHDQPPRFLDGGRAILPVWSPWLLLVGATVAADGGLNKRTTMQLKLPNTPVLSEEVVLTTILNYRNERPAAIDTRRRKADLSQGPRLHGLESQVAR